MFLEAIICDLPENRYEFRPPQQQQKQDYNNEQRHKVSDVS